MNDRAVRSWSPGRLVLLGHPVRHSLSPRIQGAALEAAGIPLAYDALDVLPADLDRVIQEVRAEGAAGNVTIPHKEEVAERCDWLSPLAKRLGAVNTFWTDGGRLHGDNTDAPGFDAAARALLGQTPAGAKIGVLGAGGAAAAVLAAIERWGNCRVSLYNRTPARAHKLADKFPSLVTVVSSVREVVGDASLVVNATAVGLHDDAFPVPLDHIPRAAAVLDLVYRPGRTAFVRAARAQGRMADDGLHMLVEQAALAFECWFGLTPDRGVMWEVARKGA